jgi:cytoskeletal protein CcmA (bactofilin family)
MFSTKDKFQGAIERNLTCNATLISAGTSLTGDVISNSDLRIDGTINGNVRCTARVIVGAGGFVDGHIESTQAEVAGRVQGDIMVKELLQLKGQCMVQGNIAAAKLLIEPTATFNGKCQMGETTAGQVVHMTETEMPLGKAK